MIQGFLGVQSYPAGELDPRASCAMWLFPCLHTPHHPFLHAEIQKDDISPASFLLLIYILLNDEIIQYIIPQQLCCLKKKNWEWSNQAERILNQAVDSVSKAVNGEEIFFNCLLHILPQNDCCLGEQQCGSEMKPSGLASKLYFVSEFPAQLRS